MVTEILTILTENLNTTNLRNFGLIVESILGISGRVNMLSISRMSSLSYRTIQRFYALKEIDWRSIQLLIFIHFFHNKEHHYLLAADETVQKKAGKQTHGHNKFYSSLYEKVISSVSFLAISIVDVTTKQSSILGVEQLVCEPRKKKEVTNEKKVAKKPSGRPKGSKNKPKEENESVSYQYLKTLLTLVNGKLKGLLPDLKCKHLALDGFYGNQHYVQLAEEFQLFLVSKLRKNSNLKFRYQGQQKPKGRHKVIGKRVDFYKLDKKYLQEETFDEETKITTSIYQFETLMPEMKNHPTINVVVILIKKGDEIGKTILFSTDLSLEAKTLIEYYSLRFQIEFDFRDAKQFYGLSDFKNYKPTQVTNAVNIAFTMTSLARVILEKYKKILKCDDMGILDLKAMFRTLRYAEIILNDNNFDPIHFLNTEKFKKIVQLEAIHIS